MKFTPSNANVWVNCAASAALQAEHPLPKVDTDGVATSREEGKAFDWLIGQCHRKCCPSEYVGKVAPSGAVVDDEMIEAAQDYLEILSKDFALEQKIKLDFLKPGQYGYCDALKIDAKNKIIHIIDAKYGHSYVEEFENLQLAIYLTGIIRQLSRTDYDGWVFNLSIFQPRCYGQSTYRTWSPTSDDLLDIIERFDNAVQAAQQPEPTATTGKHCGKCDARHACGALQRAMSDGVQYVTDSVPLVLDDTALVIEYKTLLRISELLKSRLDGLSIDITSRLQSGNVLPGIDAKRGTGRTRWVNGTNVQEIIQLSELMSIDSCTKPLELITPKQLIKKGLDPEVISDYIETPQTAVKLVESTKLQLRKTFKV